MFTSLDVAAYIARECDRRGYSYNNTKIQKLLYIVYGAMLAWKEERICDEYPRAWPYGPVFPKVFRYIDRGGDVAALDTPVADAPEAADLRVLVESAVARFGARSARSLTAWSHAKGSPWHQVVEVEDAGWNSFIPDEYIKDYFRKQVISVHRPAEAEAAHA